MPIDPNSRRNPIPSVGVAAYGAHNVDRGAAKPANAPKLYPVVDDQDNDSPTLIGQTPKN